MNIKLEYTDLTITIEAKTVKDRFSNKTLVAESFLIASAIMEKTQEFQYGKPTLTIEGEGIVKVVPKQ